MITVGGYKCSVCQTWVPQNTVHSCGVPLTNITPSIAFPAADVACQLCGSIVRDWALHNAFHEKYAPT